MIELKVNGVGWLVTRIVARASETMRRTFLD